MDRINEYYELVNACVERMDEILTQAQAEGRDLTPEEEVEYTRLDVGVEECRKMVDKMTRTANLKDALNKPSRVISFPAVRVRPSEDDVAFRSFGEFLYCLRYDPHGRKMSEYRAQTMGNPLEGGIMVPPQFRDELMRVLPENVVVRPRATVIPAGTYPDAEITIPALDQSSNLYGGMTMTTFGEGVSTTETDADFREVSLTPNSLGGHVVVTDKLLRNWEAAGPTLQTIMRQAMVAYEDEQFLTGNGVNKPTGIIGHPSAITVARSAAGQISYNDVVGMYSRILMRDMSNYVWVASQTTLPYLCNIRDAGNNNLWIQSAAAGIPPTLMGIPVVFSEHMSTLGTAGDLALANFRYYVVKDGSGPYLRVSDQVYFLQGKTVFRLEWNVDGKPWLDAPIPYQSTTVSPFVVLS